MEMPDVLFDFNKYTLKPAAREKLAKVSGILLAHSDLNVQVEGHTDSIGSEEYNQKLSEERAGSVKDYLVTLGTAADRLSTISYGEELLVCREQTEECWQKNRRVRFVVQPARPTT